LVSILKNDGLIFRLSNTGQDTPVLGYRNTNDNNLYQERRGQGKGTEDREDKSKKSLIGHALFLIMYTERLRNVHKQGMYVGYVDTVDVCDALLSVSF
jgi:hypothetical protein